MTHSWKSLKALVPLSCLLIFLQGGVFAEKDKERIAVVDFEAQGDVGVTDAGKIVARLLLSEFEDKFEMVTRTKLETLLREKNLQVSDLMNADKAAQYGKLLPVKYLVVGEVMKGARFWITAQLIEVGPGIIRSPRKVSASSYEELEQKIPLLGRYLSMSDEDYRKSAGEGPAAAAGPAKSLIVPDQYPTIQQAISAARAGDTVMVKPGIYKEMLSFKDGIRLLGTDRGACRIEPAEGARALLTAVDCRSGSVENLTFDGKGAPLDFRYVVGMQVEDKEGGVYVKEVKENTPAAQAGLQPGAALVAINGRPVRSGLELAFLVPLWAGQGPITFQFKGPGMGTPVSIRPQKLPPLEGERPSGLAILDSQIEVTECLAQGLEAGILVIGSNSAPILKRNVCRANEIGGIVFRKGAVGAAEENTCSENRGAGVVAQDSRTAPSLKKNQCKGNQRSGMVFEDGAAGVAEGNFCDENKLSGITVFGAGTSPTIRNNQCRANEQHGIAFGRGAAGVAEGNTCDGNRCTGIVVAQMGTAPMLRRNQCRSNKLHGLEFSSGASGTAEGNLSEGNAFCGIIVFGQGTASTLQGNECHGNKYGIAFSSGCGGSAQGNHCNNNAEWGIWYDTDARPRIVPDNTGSGNGKGQIKQ